jgi:sterol desaturase/sphingolipid hydroxylase (fatty acid hydroxylase superfamily)
MDVRNFAPVWLAIVVPLVLIEIVWRRRSGRGYDGRTAIATLGLAAGYVIAGLLNALVIGTAMTLAWKVAPVKWPLYDWRTWVVAFFCVEFAYYWFHRVSHRVAWLWATHSVHHSAEQMTLLSSLRLGWTNAVSGGWIVYLPLVLAGFDPRLVLGLLAFDLRYQFFLHTEAVGTLGPIEWIFNTPNHHRLHHASNAAYLDRNYGGVLIVFDRLFGTIARDTGEPVRYGLAHRAASYNPFKLAFGEWGYLFATLRRTRGIRARLATAFGPPA